MVEKQNKTKQKLKTETKDVCVKRKGMLCIRYYKRRQGELKDAKERFNNDW